MTREEIANLALIASTQAEFEEAWELIRAWEEEHGRDRMLRQAGEILVMRGQALGILDGLHEA